MGTSDKDGDKDIEGDGDDDGSSRSGCLIGQSKLIMAGTSKKIKISLQHASKNACLLKFRFFCFCFGVCLRCPFILHVKRV